MVQQSGFPMVLHRFLFRRVAALTLGLSALVGLIGLPASAQDKSALEMVKQRGSISVALYNEFAPFSDNGQGIDVDLAQALAAKLGVKASLVWFNAGDNVDGDLRKMIWKGTPLTGTADLLMHVPVDPQYTAKIDQAKIFSPYHRERFAIARQLAALPTLESLEPFEKLPFGVEGESMVAMVMLSADGGRYRESLKIFKSSGEAINALKSGTVAAVLGQQGELESGLQGDVRFAIDLPPNQLLKMQQWRIGLAVKADNSDLAQALETAMSQLLSDGTVNAIMQRHGLTHRPP
jgi:ABC-type amino acid transport substrate-binding protein